MNKIPVVSEPVSKVDSFDHHTRPLATLEESHSLEHVLDVSMAPVMALDSRYAGNISGTECKRRRWTEQYNKAEDEEDAST